MITWNYNSLTASVIVILGITAGTTLGAKLIDDGKEGSGVQPIVGAIDEVKTKIHTLTEYKQNVALDQARDINEKLLKIRDSINAASAAISTLAPTMIDPLVGTIPATSVIKPIDDQLTNAINALTVPWSQNRNWLSSMLSDNNGISLHRFQIFAWSIVLGIIFLVHVVTQLSTPQFSDTLLLLVGIGSGTYLGLKIPEDKKASS